MENDLKMLFLTKSQCGVLMDFIDSYFEEEVACRPMDTMEWACSMTDVYKKLKEVITND